MSQFKDALKEVEGQSAFDKVKDSLFHNDVPPEQEAKAVASGDSQADTLRRYKAEAKAAKEVPALITHSSAAIDREELPALIFIIGMLAVIGCMLCAGKPKLGKSWLWQQIAYAVATGGKALGAFDCGEPGDVLMLDLEGNKRRFKSRQRKILGDEPAPERLTVAFRENTRRLDNGLLDQIRKWHASVARPRMVVIDTLAAVRGDVRRSDKNGVYLQDYKTLNELTHLAEELQILIVVIHHVNKATNWDDPFDSISGSNGLMGAADAATIFRRSRNGAGFELLGRGRDLEDFEYGLAREGDRFIVVGTAADVRLSGTRREIVDALREDATGNGMTPTAIAKAAGLKLDTVRKTLGKMLKEGIDGVEKTEHGKYRLEGSSAEDQQLADEVLA